MLVVARVLYLSTMKTCEVHTGFSLSHFIFIRGSSGATLTGTTEPALREISTISASVGNPAVIEVGEHV